MPGEFQIPNRTYLANTQFAQGTFASLVADFCVAQSTTGESPVGITKLGAKNAFSSFLCASGDPVAVYGPAQECWLNISATVTAGQYLKPDVNGLGTPGSGSDVVAAEALEGGASGDFIRVRVLQPKAL